MLVGSMTRITTSFAIRLTLAIASFCVGVAFVVGPTASNVMSSTSRFTRRHTVHHDGPLRRHRSHFAAENMESSYDVTESSYDVDSDEDAEQRLGEHEPVEVWSAADEIVARDVGKFEAGRFDDLLAATNLKGKLNYVPAEDKRTVSTFDIFCNRELKLGAIRAIGFDMDYTLARYKQPEFDKLAFDGAKEKLVKKLGYPEEVLDFEYDHKVRIVVFFLVEFALENYVWFSSW